jgi:hypothetical protein
VNKTSTKKEKKIVAYEVHDGNDGWSIQFATNGASARREGANDIGCEWEDIDFCRRKPELDQYSPGPAPIKAMMEAGWWYECNCCGKHCYSDNNDVIVESSVVYCSELCSQHEWAKDRAKAKAEADLIELFESKFPGATITHVYVFGRTLEPMDRLGGARALITFTFPGGEQTGQYHYGDAFATVMNSDAAAFEAWQDSRKAA